MKRRPVAVAAILISSIGISSSAAGQCLECAQQMFQATLSSNIQYNNDQSLIRDNRSRDARNGICYNDNRDYEGCKGRPTGSRPVGISGAVDSRAESAVMEVLNSEYRRRGNAGQWLNTAAGDIGRQIAALGAEYRRRRDANGTTVADRWYVDSARQIAMRYVSGHRGPGNGEAMINGVPAATRQRAEDATFAVLESEIHRRGKARGQADAVQWARGAGTAIGSGVKNLAPEYAQRERVDGRAKADQWYVDQARNLARLHVANSER